MGFFKPNLICELILDCSPTRLPPPPSRLPFTPIDLRCFFAIDRESPDFFRSLFLASILRRKEGSELFLHPPPVPTGQKKVYSYSRADECFSRQKKRVPFLFPRDASSPIVFPNRTLHSARVNTHFRTTQEPRSFLTFNVLQIASFRETYLRVRLSLNV